MIRKSLKFMAADAGVAGGGVAATAELPPLPNMVDAYKDSLAKEQGKELDSPAATGATGPAATGVAASGATGVSGPAATGAPTSALDAALEASSVSGPTGPAAAAEEDFLKDLPETLPREGRGAHWEKARGAIGKLGTRVADQTKTIAELSQQLETAKATPPESAAEVAALKKQLDDYKDALVAINVEYEPEHRKKFLDGRKNLIAKASSKLNAFGGKGELIADALGMAEGRGRTQAIKEALADLEPVEQNRVLQIVSDVEKLDDEKAEIMKDPQGAWDKLQKAQNDARQAATQKAEDFKKTVFETVAKKLPETLFLLREVDPLLPGAEAHNANAKAMREAAFKLLGADAKPEDLVQAAFWKQAGPKLQELFLTTRKELAAALTSLKKYGEAEPGFRGGKPAAKSESEAKLDKTPGQLYKETMERLAGGEN